MGPIDWFSGYCSVHPRKGKTVLSQLPLVMWAPGCWHYERTLYSYRPLHKGPEFLSIWIKSVVMSIYIYIMDMFVDIVYMTAIDKFGGVQMEYSTIMNQHLSTPIIEI